MYIIVVWLSRNRSARMRHHLMKNGFAIYKIGRLTQEYSRDEDPDENELMLDDRLIYLDEGEYYYEAIYNGHNLPAEFFQLFEKLEAAPSVIKLQIVKQSNWAT